MLEAEEVEVFSPEAAVPQIPGAWEFSLTVSAWLGSSLRGVILLDAGTSEAPSSLKTAILFLEKVLEVGGRLERWVGGAWVAC